MPAAKRTPSRAVILLTLSLGQFITVLHIASTETGLPVVQRALDASGSDLSWILNSHLLFFAGLLLPLGAIGDFFGHRKVFIAGLITYGFASIIASAAVEVYQIVIMRGIMGVASGALVPASLALISEVFPDRSQFRKAVGVWSGAAPAGGVIGLVGTGMIVKFFYWGSFFLLTLPFVLIGLVGAFLAIPASKKLQNSTQPFDPLGAFLGTVSVGAFIYGVIEGPNNGWGSTSVVGMFLISAVAAATFIIWELKIPHAVLTPRHFRSRGFAVPLLAAVGGSAGLFAYVYLLPQYFQFAQGHTALDSGLRTLAHALLAVPVSMLVPYVIARHGIRFTLCAGLMLEATGFAWMAISTPETPYWIFMFGLAIAGSGFSFLVTTTPAAIVAALPDDQAGVGSATSETSKMMGGAMGIAAGGTLLATGFRQNIKGTTGELSQEFSQRGTEAAESLAETLGGAEDSIGRSLSAAEELREFGTEFSIAAAMKLEDAAVSAFDAGMNLALGSAAVLAFAAAVGVAIFYPKEVQTDEAT